MAGSTTTITRQLGPSSRPTAANTTTTLTLDHSSPSPSSSSHPPPREILTLELKQKKKNKMNKKVTWKEGTVDNEFLQKKSSKKCCIFHKDKPFDDDLSDDDDDHDHDHGDGSCSSGGGK